MDPYKIIYTIYIVSILINIIFCIIDVRFIMQRLNVGYLLTYIILGIGLAPLGVILYLMKIIGFMNDHDIWEKLNQTIVDFLCKDIITFNKNKKEKDI